MFQIMVVDDDRNTRRLLQAVLEADGYKVLTAENGEDALTLMDTEYVDLVVLDIMMPKMDGYEFTRTLRETNNNLPVLMVSAKELPSDKKHGFLVGTDDYMTKPIDEEEMLWRIKALLRRAKIASERRIVVGDVVLDYDCLTVSRKGEVQELPQKEFLLLYKLADYPDDLYPYRLSNLWRHIRHPNPHPRYCGSGIIRSGERDDPGTRLGGLLCYPSGYNGSCAGSSLYQPSRLRPSPCDCGTLGRACFPRSCQMPFFTARQ